MRNVWRRLSCTLALAAGALAPLAGAHAATIDFESPLLTGLYFPGESFSEAGFQMTQQYDAGIVDRADPASLVAPTGNSTQFYSATNEGGLRLSHQGAAFSLDGFSAAFIPLANSSAPQQIVLTAFATTVTGQTFATFFNLGNTLSTTQGSPFLSFSSALDFGQFKNLASVEFFACAVGTGPICRTPLNNNGQFALDDIHVTAVPEPSTYALMALGLMALGLARRRAQHNAQDQA